MVKGWHITCFSVLLLVCTGFGWDAGDLTVTVTNSPMDIKVSAGTKTLLDVTGISFGGTNYTSISSVTTATDSLVINLAANVSVTIKPVFSGIQVYGKVSAATSVKITMKDQNDHFFGITEQNINGNSPDLRTRTIAITARNIQTLAQEPHAKVWSAFYMSSLGYGSFFNTFAEGTYVFGSGGVTTITHTTNTIDWYIYYGPTGDKIHKAYFKTIQILENLGTRSPIKKVPIWACGPVIWHNNYSGSAQVLGHIEKYTSNSIPLTAQWIDRPYSDGGDGWGYMNWAAAFANPKTWIQQITGETGYNVKLMTWIAPCTFGTPVPPAGTYFSGGYYYLDLTNPAATSWYKQKLDSLQNDPAVGIQGHKMDRCEETMTQVMSGSWHDGTPTTEKQPKYLYLNAKVTDEILRANWGDNQFNFPRGAYHRAQPYIGGVWAGDTRAPWAGLVGAVANGIKTAFCGFPMWGSDIGGYGTGATKIPSDQYLRWLTFGCFSGFMENMLDGKEPYIYTSSGDAVEGQTFTSRYKSVCDLRMSLLPYVYSLANTSADNGVIMRPLPYMYPDDANTYEISDEYLFGDAFLVAPITSASTSRRVYLPAGTWYYFFDQTETHTSTGGSITTPAIPVYRIPVYIKENSVYVTGRIYAGNSKKWISNFDDTKNDTINAFPGAAGETATFTYVDYLDKDTKKSISVESGDDDFVRVRSPAMTIPTTVKVRLSAAPTSVRLNEVALSSPAQYQYTAPSLLVPVASQVAVDLQINGQVVATLGDREKPSLHGRLQAHAVGNGIALIVPPATGLHDNSRIDVRLFDMRGKLLWKGAVAAKEICSSSYLIPLSNVRKGSYVAAVNIDGIVAQHSKILIY
ncbi:MAG: hypothetical protein JXA18_15185 [Chitinispirillaceae bacterium]|nr:hypothetical protein [Chitinispirillaceae bacterium]